MKQIWGHKGIAIPRGGGSPRDTPGKMGLLKQPSLMCVPCILGTELSLPWSHSNPTEGQDETADAPFAGRETEPQRVY